MNIIIKVIFVLYFLTDSLDQETDKAISSAVLYQKRIFK